MELTDSEWVVEYNDAPPESVACPDDGDWKGELLFKANPHLAAGGPVPSYFRRYCRYTWSGANAPAAGPTPGDVSWFPANIAGVAQKNPVTIGMAPQGLLRDTVGEMLLTRFQWRYQDFGPGSSFTNTLSARAPVTLAVVDTKPNDTKELGRSAHGLRMIELAKPIACPDDVDCTVDIVPSLGLPRIQGGVADWDKGGHYADASDVALGILEAVSRWEAAPTSRLVINLSVGIDLELFAPAGVGIEASRNVLRDALRYARCHGTVVAAAGNDIDLGTEGALYPASLATDPMPSNNDCNNLFGVQNTPPVGTTPYRPLVHAIGGLNDSPGATPVTRDGSMPRLAAPATSATYLSGSSTDPYGPITTGTSNASIVAAASAALMLSFDSQLGRAGVMQHLYDRGGGTLLGNAELYYAPAGQAPPVRRLMLCDALDAICGGGGCGALQLDCATGAIPYTDADISDALLTLVPPDDIDEAEVLFGTDEWCPGLGRDVVFTEGQTADCDLADYEPMDRITTPQPDEPVCDYCPYTTTSTTLTLQLDPAYEEELSQYDVTRAVVTFFDDSGTPVDFVLENPDASTTKPVRNFLPDDDERLPATISHGRITVTFGSGMVRSDTIDIVAPYTL